MDRFEVLKKEIPEWWKDYGDGSFKSFLAELSHSNDPRDNAQQLTSCLRAVYSGIRSDISEWAKKLFMDRVVQTTGLTSPAERGIVLSPIHEQLLTPGLRLNSMNCLEVTVSELPASLYSENHFIVLFSLYSNLTPEGKKGSLKQIPKASSRDSFGVILNYRPPTSKYTPEGGLYRGSVDVNLVYFSRKIEAPPDDKAASYSWSANFNADGNIVRVNDVFSAERMRDWPRSVLPRILMVYETMKCYRKTDEGRNLGPENRGAGDV